MILKEATIKYKGYNPDDLKLHSGKRICCSCDICGRVRWIAFNQYRNLCTGCSKIGSKRSKETRQKMKDNHWNLSGKNNPMWNGGLITLICKVCKKEFKVNPFRKNAKFCSKKCMGKWQSENCVGKNASNWQGGFDKTRSYIVPKYRCIKINKYFIGSEFHHITKSIGVYIPKILHHHIYHNIKTGKNMGEMNVLAIQFINGGL